MKLKFKNLSATDKKVYQDRATRLIYPDLRVRYLYHDKIVNKLAKALFECEELIVQGGPHHGQPPTHYNIFNCGDDFSRFGKLIVQS